MKNRMKEKHIFQLKHSVSKSQKKKKKKNTSQCKVLFYHYKSGNIFFFLAFFLFRVRKRKKRQNGRYKVYANIKTALKNKSVLYIKWIWITNQDWHIYLSRLTDTVWETIFLHLLSKKEVLIGNQIERKSGADVLSSCGCYPSTKGISASCSSTSHSPGGQLLSSGKSWEMLVPPPSLSFTIDMITGYLQA